MIDRRDLIAGAALGATFVTFPVEAQISPSPPREPIWPGVAPGGGGVMVRETSDNGRIAHIVRPTITSYVPASPNGAALLVIPGGGYRYASMQNEGHLVGTAFAAMGYHCFVLAYRMPADGWEAGSEAPLQDAQRAMRVVRARAGKAGFDPGRIGVIGFSAGGHLAGWLANQPARRTYAPVDASDSLPARPRVAGLVYPVVQMAGSTAHRGSREQLVGVEADASHAAAFDTDRMVTASSPPTFLVTAVDDATVPIENSLAMFAALRTARVPAELHLFERGGHGFGLRGPDGAPSPWPGLFAAWAKPHLLA